MSIKLSETPQEHYTKLFENLLHFRGVEGSKRLLIDDDFLKAAFPWVLSKEGHEFWETIDNGGKVITTTKSETVEEVVAEAESRGFNIGVWTKFGQIVSGEDHELQSDGSFYYRNVMVRTKKGKWCKPNVKPKKNSLYNIVCIPPSKTSKNNDVVPDISSDEDNDVPSDREVASAIHGVLKRMFEDMHK
jgi:hypothetical protein